MDAHDETRPLKRQVRKTVCESLLLNYHSASLLEGSCGQQSCCLDQHVTRRGVPAWARSLKAGLPPRLAIAVIITATDVENTCKVGGAVRAGTCRLLV